MNATDPRPLIAHVVYRFAVGGLENGVVNLINRLPESRWRHAVVALDRVDTAFRQRVKRDDVRFIELRKRPGHLVREYPRLVRLLRELAPTIVHTRNLAALEAQVPAMMAGVRARIHGEHGRDADDPDGSNVRRQRIRKLYRPFVHRYVAVSPDLAAYLRDRIGVPAARVVQILNGVDTAKFHPAAGGRVPIAGAPFGARDELLFGTVGRLDPVKDHVNLLRAFEAMLRQDPALRSRARLVIVGEGPERAAIEACVTGAGLDGLVWFAGERADVADILRGLDVFVLPSRGEGLSNTVLEAMASALPVVATRVGANPDLLSEGVSGRLVPHSDSAALAAAMHALAVAPEERAAMGRASRAAAVARFGLDAMVTSYGDLYASCTATGWPKVPLHAQPAENHCR